MTFTNYPISDILVTLFILLVFFYIMNRIRKKPHLQKLDWDLSYDYVSEPATTENDAFVETFKDTDFPREDDVHLIRLAFINRGSKDVAVNDHQRPVTVTLPEGADIIDARFNERHKSALGREADPTFQGRTITIAPFALEADGILIFNLVVRGAADIEKLDAALTEQAEVQRLGLTFRFMKKGGR